jgi:hypothetical protein
MFDMPGSNEIRLLLSAQDDATSKIAGLVAALGPLGVVAGVVAAAFGAVTAAIGMSIKATIDWGATLHDIQIVMGDTSEQAAGLKLATDVVGVSTELVTNKMMLLEKGLEGVGGKLGTSGKELENLHIAFRNADGTFMDSTELLQSIADHFGNMANGTEKNSQLMLLFGRSAGQMNEFLTQLANEGMNNYITKAKALGLAITDDQVEKIHTLQESINLLKDALLGIEVTFGSAFITPMQHAAFWLGEIAAKLQPVVAQFAAWATVKLDNLFGGPGGNMLPGGGGTSGGGGASSGVPAGWKYIGTVNGPGTAPVYTSGTGDLTTYHTGQLGGGSGAGGGSMPIPAGGPADQGHGATVYPTAFETALGQFADSVKNNFVPTIKDFWTAFTMIPWQTIATDLIKFGTAMNTLMGSEVVQLLTILITKGGPQALGQGIMNELFDPNSSFGLSKTGGLGDRPTLGAGMWADGLRLDFKSLGADDKPITAPAMSTIMVTSGTNTAASISSLISQSNTDLKTTIGNQNTTLLNLNNLMASLPSLIQSAILRGQQ